MVGRTAGFILVLLAAGWSAQVVGATPTTMPTSAPEATAPGPSDALVRQTVQQLSHPSRSKRILAMRRLAEWGPASFSELRRAAKGADLEAALAARDLLAQLEGAVLTGARVRLETNRQTIRWDEPLTLTVHAFNPTNEPIRVPWPAQLATADTLPAHEIGESADSARQVGAIMDAGDFLIVSGPDGEPLEARVDPIEGDPAVYDAVNSRARREPLSHALPAKASEKLVITAFNRGWARYPMLRAGQYRICFSYQPQWRNQDWTAEGFGLVRSEPVEVRVIQAAPEAIIAVRGPLQLDLRRENNEFVAEMMSLWDRELWINLNMGDELLTHARLEYRLVPADDAKDEELSFRPATTGAAFDLGRVIRLKPGERREIGRVSREELRGLTSTAQMLMARYSSLGTAPRIREELSERGLTVHVPTQLFTGTVSSEAVRLDSK